MAVDPRKMRPGEVVRLLNSTPLGEVLTEAALRRHRNRAGAKVGGEKTVDLLKYAAWLHGQCHDPPVATKPAKSWGDSYDAHKKRVGQRQAMQSEERREIGPLPEPLDPERRAACEFSLRLFCETYLSE